jgi:hypothetical protein
MDYSLGLLFLPILLTAIPLLWLLILLLFKCLGGRRVGFLSGVRFVEERNIFDSKRGCCRPSVITLFMCALGAAGMVASYLLFATLATDEYLGAFDTIRGGWNVSDLICVFVVGGGRRRRRRIFWNKRDTQIGFMKFTQVFLVLHGTIGSYCLGR